MVKSSLTEVRADAFARDTLLPQKLLLSLCNQFGIKPTTMTPQDLAVLVAESGVEKKTVVQVLFDNALIDDALVGQYLSYDIAAILRQTTDHALTTAEYIEKIGKDAALVWENKRFTSIAKRNLLLPVPYVTAVLDAVRTFSVSISRAAELLMIDESLFFERFPAIAQEVSE
jgi:hypothetical protein